MARNTERTVTQRLADMEHRIRHLECPGNCPPDKGWVLAEVGDSLRYLYVPSGQLGPEIGLK